MQRATIQVERATRDDSAGIAAVLETIASERIHSGIVQAWTVEQERQYLDSLSPREAIHLVVDGALGVVGFQSLDLWSPALTSMSHVG